MDWRARRDCSLARGRQCAQRKGVDPMTMLMVSAGRCQFCHRTDGDVARIFAGDSGYICDECVKSCAKLLTSTTDQSTADHDADRFAYQRLIRHFAPLRAH